MKRLILIGLLMCVMATTAGAQVRFGIRGGITVGELRFDRDVINSDNRVGYTGGLLVDLSIPIVGLGLEASAMYTHRNNRLTDQGRVYKRSYIDIPVYARFRLPITGIERIVAPLVFTGPSFSVLFDDNKINDYSNRKTYVSWDVGAGADLFTHLRITATYGIGISKAMHYINSEYNGDKIEGKDRYWTLSAAYLF